MRRRGARTKLQRRRRGGAHLRSQDDTLLPARCRYESGLFERLVPLALCRRLERDGRSLLISGIDQGDWKFKFTNGEFKTEIVDQTTPRDPAAVDRAMELVDG